MKIKNIGFAIIVGILGITISCKEEKKDAAPADSKVEIQENSKTTAALNPVHGVAGHRCDIPVGAPLDQAASTNTAQQSNPTISSDVSPVWANKPAPVKNPPHGQPGHDCAVPVGADLKP
jgi:hypothetical protein